MSVSVSTHVLDTATGKPAAGVRVELWQGGELLGSGDTDADGRIGQLASGLEPGLAEIVFHPPSEFFRRVTLEIVLEDGHVHIPLLVSPYACAAYRGS